jgi:hypothetical protein
MDDVGRSTVYQSEPFSAKHCETVLFSWKNMAPYLTFAICSFELEVTMGGCELRR